MAAHDRFNVPSNPTGLVRNDALKLYSTQSAQNKSSMSMSTAHSGDEGWRLLLLFFLGFNVSTGGKLRLRSSDYADAQTDLNLYCTHIPT